tara:strand:+ start:453 stop:821 length:369 start_codon:yes stop_codon:yes gene_type:complete
MEAATPQTVTVTEAAAGNDAIDDATVTTQSLPVPRSVVGHIIGKGGVNIKKTQEVSGCRVKITDASDGGGGGDESSESSFWAYARLRGTPRQIDGAKRRIIGLIYSLEDQSRYDRGYENNDL